MPSLRVIALWALVAGTAALTAQDTQGMSAAGQIIDTSGNPVTHAAVALVSQTGQVPTLPSLQKPLSVDADGRFRLTDIPRGGYRLVVATRSALEGWPDPAVVARHAPRAFPLDVVSPGSTLQLIVAVGPDPERAITIERASFTREELMGGPGRTPGAPPRPGVMPNRPASGPPQPGSITGIVRDDLGRPLAGVSVQAGLWSSPASKATSRLLPLALPVTSDAHGVYLIPNLPSGTYVVAALEWRSDRDSLGLPSRRSVPSTAREDGTRTGLRTTYYPRLTDVRRATDVIVARDAVTGVDIHMLATPVSTARVRLTGGTTGTPPFALTTLTPDAQPAPWVDRLTVRGTTREGEVTFTDVSPGRYTFSYYTPMGWARGSLTVDSGRDAEPVAMTLQAPLEVSGRVDAHATRAPGGPEALRGLTVSLNQFPVLSGPVLRSPIDADGRFTITGVPGGLYTLTLASGTGWSALHGVVNGVDTLDGPVTLTDSTTDARLVISDRETTIQGRVSGTDGNAAAGVVVAVYSADERHWSVGTTRRVRVLTAGPGGVFNLSGLPPGNYLAFAAPPGTRITNGLLRDSRDAAVAFSLDVAETRVLPLVVRR